MTGSSKRWLVSLALVAAVVFVALSVQQLAVTVVSAAVAAVVAILVHRSLGAAPGSAPTSEDSAPARAEWIDHLQKLAGVNLLIREQALDATVVARLEQSIDVLRRLIPELNQDHAGSELTWTVNRMASDYLARIVKPFAALGAAARDEHRAELLLSLEGLDAELANIVELLKSARVGEFKTKAAFLRARFLDPNLG